jgi:sec-independent protein translocase protein TatA
MQLQLVLAGILGGLGAPEIILIALIVLLLFGGKKIPELMKGMGKGIKNFKEGMKGMEDEINQPVKPDTDKEKPAESKP